MMSVGLKFVSKDVDVDVAMPVRMVFTEIGHQRCLI
jgi:hypothetical protein